MLFRHDPIVWANRPDQQITWYLGELGRTSRAATPTTSLTGSSTPDQGVNA
jgi:hypothetical protein